MQSIVDIEIRKILTDLYVTDLLTKIISQAKHDHTLLLLGINHIAMWTRLLTLVNPMGVGHMAMWTMGVIQITMWTIGIKSHGDVS